MSSVLEKGRRLGGFILADIGLSLTLGYVFLTVVGMAHLARFYAAFHVNIFDYADAGDFLLAGVRDPVVILVTVAPVPGAWLYLRAVAWLDRRTPERLRGRAFGGPMSERSRGFVFALLVITWTTAAVLHHARTSAHQVREGKGTLVALDYLNGPAVSAPADPASPGNGPPATFLLGTTARYVILYDVVSRGVNVVPVGNVARIRPLRRAGR